MRPDREMYRSRQPSSRRSTIQPVVSSRCPLVLRHLDVLLVDDLLRAGLRIDLDLLLGDVLIDDHELDAAILLASVLAAVVGDRSVAAISHRNELLCGDPVTGEVL